MNPSSYLHTIIFGFFVAGCAGHVDSTEEAAYQKFVSKRKEATYDSAMLRQLPAMQEQAYIESGIPDFITNGEEKTMVDMDSFYKNVIVGKFAGHPAQGYLKGKFIQYEINYFDFTHSQKPEELKQLAMLTREVMQSKDHDMPFIYDCLSACRGVMEKEEYNTLVRQARFEIRYMRDFINEALVAESSRIPYTDKARKLKTMNVEKLSTTIKSFEKSMAMLDSLKML